MIVGLCKHGIALAWCDELIIDEDQMREFAVTYRCERRKEIKLEGECLPCKDEYRKNCELLGIES
jgi:hypothetical protein